MKQETIREQALRIAGEKGRKVTTTPEFIADHPKTAEVSWKQGFVLKEIDLDGDL